jgi:hypothetical protein
MQCGEHFRYVHVKNPGDLEGAQKVLGAITVQGLSRYQGKPGPTR